MPPTRCVIGASASIGPVDLDVFVAERSQERAQGPVGARARPIEDAPFDGRLSHLLLRALPGGALELLVAVG